MRTPQNECLPDPHHLVNTVHELHCPGHRSEGPHRSAGIDTTAAGRLVFGIFAALSERELIVERTIAGPRLGARGLPHR
jgi:DNA invertase Pin-like site-specific DNA recombinase